MTDTNTKLLEIKNLYKSFPLNQGFLEQLQFKNGRFHLQKDAVNAINGVSLDVNQGEALCVVGESGCGKSTVARVVMSLLKPTQGSIYYQGKRIDSLTRQQLMPYHKKMQMIFQNPYSSLNPRMTVRQMLEEPVRFHNENLSNTEVSEKVAMVMESVGIDPVWITRYPHEFSGGQRQRISIARALTVDPEFIVADEPISALDVSIQAQVLNLLMEAQEKRNLTYLFITHDLSVVEHFGTRVAVMYLGTICELAITKDLFAKPLHPYSRSLISAIPKLGKSKDDYIKLKGEVPTPINLPTGCVFHNRCQFSNARCKAETPMLIAYGEGRMVSCHALEENRIE